jgi:phage repressor protein C with HTH and peptisase S24 domain
VRRFAEKKLSANGFFFNAPAFRGGLFVNPDTSQAVLLDHRICDTQYPFAYTLYTKEQNALMHKYRGVFRFMADTRDDLADAARTLDRLLNREFAEDSIQTKGRHRHWHDIDPTMPEALFEQAFIDCYGRRALDRVIREFPVIDMNGHTRWVDYFIRTRTGDLAIEKNGETWHHQPLFPVQTPGHRAGGHPDRAGRRQIRLPGGAAHRHGQDRNPDCRLCQRAQGRPRRPCPGHGAHPSAAAGPCAEVSKPPARPRPAGRIQFLATCSLLNEGWDSPRTSVIVMARPTMSKVLYTQQLGRGTRTFQGKESLYVIDVVDNYGALGGFRNQAWSIHALLGIQAYKPWADILEPRDSAPSPEEIILAGLYEQERAIETINIFTFENEYPDHLDDEQLARELFVSTGTVRAWVRNNRISPAVTVPLGRRKINYFAPDQVDRIRQDLGLKVHDETTQYDDFFEFLETGDFTMSYKMVMLLTLLTIVDNSGECDLDRLVEDYTTFYRHRLDAGWQVDKPSCPYQHPEKMDDHAFMKTSLLQNPFEKFERKRFLYHCKDLKRIAFANTLWQKINTTRDLDRIKTLYFNSLKKYYQDMGGLPDEADLRHSWQIPADTPAAPPETETPEAINIIPFEDIPAARFRTALPLVGRLAAGEPFQGFDVQDLAVLGDHIDWVAVPERLCSEKRYVVQVAGDSMAPTIRKGDYLVCEYHRHRQPGRDIVIMGDFSTLSDGEVAVKRILESEHTWIFTSDNPAYQDINVEKTEDEQYPILGTVLFNLTQKTRC